MPRPVFTAAGAEVPGLTIHGDDASATFRYEGEAVSEQRADEIMSALESED